MPTVSDSDLFKLKSNRVQQVGLDPLADTGKLSVNDVSLVQVSISRGLRDVFQITVCELS